MPTKQEDPAPISGEEGADDDKPPSELDAPVEPSRVERRGECKFQIYLEPIECATTINSNHLVYTVHFYSICIPTVPFGEVVLATLIRTTAIVLVLVAIGVAWYENRDAIRTYIARGSWRGAGVVYQEVEMEGGAPERLGPEGADRDAQR